MARLLWIDMEMTGLDVEKEVILEVGAIITDMDFNELDSYHAILKQPQKFLDTMDAWNQEHHKQSGLVDLVPKGQEPHIVELDLIALTDKHFKDEKPVLAGNSIGQDRLFINRYMPRFAAKLHYRMLDVTAWKILMNNKFNIKFEKKNGHRAVDDIKESIAELKYYSSFIKSV